MKVLVWCEKYLPNLGGVEVFTAALMQALKLRGYEFTVITSKTNRTLPDEDEIEGVPVYRFPFYPPLLEHNLPEMARVSARVSSFKRRTGFDIVHMNSTGPSVFYHLHTNQANGCPVLTTAHAPPSFVDGPLTLFGKLCRSSDRIAVVSDALRRSLVGLVPDVADRAETVYNGLEFPLVDPTPRPINPPHVVCVGRVVEEKGFDVALRAFKLLRDRLPAATMTLAGDGPAKSELELLAADLGLADAVNFTGWIARDVVAELMGAASMVVVPSRWEEPFGLVALQAAQVSRPVVATRVGGLPEVVSDNETGFLVRAEDPEEMYTAMLKLVDDPDLATRFGEQGQRRAKSEFSMSRCADEYDRLFHQLAEKTSISNLHELG